MRKSKPTPRGDCTFKVLLKMGANAYKLELQEDMTVLTTFNMVDWCPYVKDDINLGGSMENSLKGREDDVCHDTEQRHNGRMVRYF